MTYRHMRNFTPIQLRSAPDDPDYHKAIKAFRRWAGPHVHVGEAGVFAAGKEGELILRELVVNRICALHLVPSELYGCAMSYTAETPASAVRSNAGIVEALKLHMRVDTGSAIWITGMAIVERESSEAAEWQFQLTPQARQLAVASFLNKNGVNPEVEINALAEAVEKEGRRLAILAGA